jgi:hypothetical protein
MTASKLGALFACLALSTSVSAFPVCGFDVPDGDDLHFHKENGCSVSIPGKKNYAGLDYLTFYDHSGIDKLLSDDTFFIQERGASYFVSEEFDDPKVTVKTKSEAVATPISFNGMSGYTAEVDYFVQFLPNWNGRRDSGYSLNISCTFVAAGDQQKAFKTRFCAPQTDAGRRQMALYKSLVNKIQPQH